MQIEKWRSHLIVRLSSQLIHEFNLKQGDEICFVEMKVKSDCEVNADRKNRLQKLAILQTVRSLRQTFPIGIQFDREESNSR
jgi:antitoxin component of MazEF toxin-antitoxin module